MKQLTASLLLVSLSAAGQTVTTQTTTRLTESGDNPPLAALVADATEPAEPLTPVLHVAVPDDQAPRLMNLVNPAIAIPFNSPIRQIEAYWNGVPLRLIDPQGTLVVEEAHSFGSMIPFFKPLFSLAGIAAGPGTLEIRGFDSAHALVASIPIGGLSIVNPPAAVPTATIAALPHPRIYLTAARLAAIRARGATDSARMRYEAALNNFLDALTAIPDVTSPEFENRVYDPESYIPLLGLTWQLRKSDDPATAMRAANAAHTLAMRIANAYTNGTRDFGRDTGYDIRFGLRNLMLAYDWMYDQFTPAERAQIITVATRWIDWYHNTPGYTESWPPENYYAGYLQGIVLVATAIAGDSPDADRFFTLLRTKLVAEVPVLNQRLAGGDWAEGWNYGPYSTLELSLVHILLRDLGEDWASDFDWLQALGRSFTYQVAPDFSQTRSYGGYSGNYADKTSPSTLAVLSSTTNDGALAQRIYTSANANPNNDFTDVPSDTFYEMIFDTAGSQADVSSLPLSYLNNGTGRFFSRSSLTDPQAFFVSSENTGYSFDHYGYANGDVRLYHGALCLVCPAAYRGPAFDGEAGTPAFSTYLVNGQQQMIGLNRNNQNLFAIDRGTFAAVGMRFESSWAVNRYDEGIVDAANPLDYMIREAVHLRPGTLIVRDLHRRRHTADTLRAFFHLGPSDNVQNVGSGRYVIGSLNVSTFYPNGVTVSFAPDRDGGGNLIGTLMQIDFPATVAPQELITVFSESLTGSSYNSGVLILSDGSHVTLANGTITVQGSGRTRRRAARR